jgi:NADPH:quinone reductase-like Zn-dependent oxidoreductase
MQSSNGRTAKAYVLERLGFDGLEQKLLSLTAPPPKHLLIRMRAVALNYRDLKIVKGLYARPPKLPLIPLSDGAGEVVETGTDVTAVQIGSRVMPIYMQGWYTGPQTRERLGWLSRGGDIDGTAVEYLVCHENDVVRIPDSMTYEQAACLPCAGVTAWHALISVGRLQAGQSVLVLGSGGVSNFAIQIARIRGASSIAITRSALKADGLRKIGATNVVDASNLPGWDNEVRALTGGKGVDHVVEVGGRETIERSINATSAGGQVHIIGDLSGAFPPKDLDAQAVSINSITVGSKEMHEDLTHEFERSGAKPIIDRVFPFSQLAEAFNYLDKGTHFGKIVGTF